MPITVPFIFEHETLACGAHLKNTFCLAKNNQVLISHHIGDLQNQETLSAFEEGIEHFKKLFDIEPMIIAHDLHPEYLSTKYAKNLAALNLNLRTIPIQHHHAHIVSCLADNGLSNHKVIGVAFDGTGFGRDGNIWGGEFLIADYVDFERIAYLKYIPLPGGEQAIRQPWRMAATYLYQAYGERFLKLNLAFIHRVDKDKWKVLKNMIEKRINCPLTSSIGRLFDAVSSLVGIRDVIDYEGQAAVELEMAIKSSKSSSRRAGPSSRGQGYEFEIKKENQIYIIDPIGIIKGVVQDLQGGTRTSVISEKFHNTIARIIVETCVKIRQIFTQDCEPRAMNYELNEVALSGGVFQNKFLLKETFDQLSQKGFRVYLHHRVPTNDGGISLGQAVIANAKMICV